MGVVKKVMEEKEKEMVVVRKGEREKEKEKEERGKEALVERGKEKEAPVEREKEEREEKEVIPTAQVKCHQLRISWPRHRILLQVTVNRSKQFHLRLFPQLRFVCSPPWDGLTVTW